MLPLTEWWYGRRETAAAPVWHLQEPSITRGFRALPIDDRTAITLRYSRAWSAKWVTRNGKPVHGYYCEWDAGRVPPENMNVHQPGGCLANLGMKLLEELAPLEVNAGGMMHQVRLMRFQDGSRPLYLIYSVTESSRSNHSSTSPFDFTYGNRWEYVFSGRRNPGQRFIEIGLWDEPSEEVVRTEFTAFLTEWIREGNL